MSIAKHFRLFFVVFGISFIGSVPIGTLNASIANYALQNKFMDAFEFGLAAILVEVVLVRVALIVVDKLFLLKKLFKVLSAIMCLAILLLSFKSLEAAFHMRNFQDTLPFVSMHPFYSGLALSMLNPLHLPFWLGWTAVLKTRNILIHNAMAYNVYILGIGIGSASAFILYGFAGNFLMNVLKAQHNLINWLLGCTLLFTGLVQLYKIITNEFKRKESATGTNN